MEPRGREGLDRASQREGGRRRFQPTYVEVRLSTVHADEASSEVVAEPAGPHGPWGFTPPGCWRRTPWSLIDPDSKPAGTSWAAWGLQKYYFTSWSSVLTCKVRTMLMASWGDPC